RRRHTRSKRDWSSDVCSSDLPPFINAVALIKTDLSPIALLDALQSLEQDAGRIRTRHWGERTLDLDILLFNEQTIEHPRLKVPQIGRASCRERGEIEEDREAV